MVDNRKSLEVMSYEKDGVYTARQVTFSSGRPGTDEIVSRRYLVMDPKVGGNLSGGLIVCSDTEQATVRRSRIDIFYRASDAHISERIIEILKTLEENGKVTSSNATVCRTSGESGLSTNGQLTQPGTLEHIGSEEMVGLQHLGDREHYGWTVEKRPQGSSLLVAQVITYLRDRAEGTVEEYTPDEQARLEETKDPRVNGRVHFALRHPIRWYGHTRAKAAASSRRHEKIGQRLDLLTNDFAGGRYLMEIVGRMIEHQEEADKLDVLKSEAHSYDPLANIEAHIEQGYLEEVIDSAERLLVSAIEALRTHRQGTMFSLTRTSPHSPGDARDLVFDYWKDLQAELGLPVLEKPPAPAPPP